MLIRGSLKYFIHLTAFLIFFNLSEPASIDLMTSTSMSTSSVVDFSTTTEKSLKNDLNNSNNERATKLKNTLKECDMAFSWFCAKLEIVKLLEQLMEREELHLYNGISIVKDPKAGEIKDSELMADIARSYPNDPDSRLNGYIMKKVHNFLQTHYLHFKLIDDKIIEEARSLVEMGRKDKFGKKGGIEALIAAGLMMKGTLMAISMGGIVLIAGKALITAVMALTMAAAVGLKSLASGGEAKSHTYEIVAKPVYTSSHTHSVSHDDVGHGGHLAHSGSGYGGYARTLNLN